MDSAAVARVGLYAMATESGVPQGQRILAGVPVTGKNEDLASYYLIESRNRWRAGVNHPVLSTGMVLGMRTAVQLAVFDYEDEMPTLLPGRQPTSVRLAQSMIGDIAGFEEMNCRKYAAAAAVDAFGLVMGTAFWRHAPVP